MFPTTVTYENIVVFNVGRLSLKKSRLFSWITEMEMRDESRSSVLYQGKVYIAFGLRSILDYMLHSQPMIECNTVSNQNITVKVK